jgi:F0F1-type ATP synthase assembly protein I
MHPKNNLIMRFKEMYQRHKLQVVEAILLMALLTALWRIDNWFVSVICGVSAGFLFYRLAERISQHGIRKA